MIGIVTDSASMLPPVWRERSGIAVAPMTVVIEGVPYREGNEITAAAFYARLSEGAKVSTSAPSPGDVLAALCTAIERGASSIVAVHTGSEYSAVLDATRIAARSVDVPVELVDTGTVSFPVSLCLAAAVDARDAGGDVAEVAGAARTAASAVDSIFIVGVPELARRGGRLHGSVAVPTATTLLTLGPAGLAEHGEASDLDDAIEQMAAHVDAVAGRHPVRVGVGDADRPDFGDRLAARIGNSSGVAEVVRYEIGPSVGAHSGAGTVGAVWVPLGHDS